MSVTGYTKAGADGKFVRVVDFGSTAGTSRGGSGGTVLWVGDKDVTPTNTVSGDIVLNASA